MRKPTSRAAATECSLGRKPQESLVISRCPAPKGRHRGRCHALCHPFGAGRHFNSDVPGAYALVVLHIFLRPGACPLEIHARFYIGRLSNFPAFVRGASQAAFGGLRGATDDGGGAAFGLETNVKLQGASPWPLTKKPLIVQHSHFHTSNQKMCRTTSAYAPGYTLPSLRDCRPASRLSDGRLRYIGITADRMLISSVPSVLSLVDQ